MLQTKTINLARPLLDNLYHHPFQVNLRCNTLDHRIFQYFIQHDDYYLLNFARILKKVSIKESDTVNSERLAYLANYIFSVERKIHIKYTDGRNRQRVYFFNFGKKKPLINKIILEYINFLDFHASHSHLAVAISSLVPCFYLYKELGIMGDKPEKFFVYNRWLKSYQSTEFLLATEIMMGLYYDYGNKHYELHNDMLLAFRGSAIFESKFLDSCMEIKENLGNYSVCDFVGVNCKNN